MKKLNYKLYDIGFIFCFLAATTYHYFEYLVYPKTSGLVILVMAVFLHLGVKLTKAIAAVHIKSLRRDIEKIHFLFLTFLIVSLIIHIIEWPAGANHSNFSTFILIILLTLYTINFLNHKQLELALFRNRFFLLSSLITVYFMAALHKMNYDFFSPIKSCANWYHLKFFQRFFLNLKMEDLPLFVRKVSPNLVIAIEVLGPLLLLFKITRNYGLYFLIALHSYLALGGFTDFSSLALSILILYFPLAQNNFKQWFNGCFVFFLFSLTIIPLTLVSHFLFYDLRPQFQTLQGFVFLASLSFFFMNKEFKLHKINMNPYKFILWDSIIFLQIFMIILFGVLPYLGYRSAGTFTMFSNLRIVGTENNHYFMKKINFFNHDEELFKVVSVSPSSFLLEDRQFLDSISRSAINFSFYRFKDLSPDKDFKLEIIDATNTVLLLNKKNISSFIGPQKPWYFYKSYMYSYLPDKKNNRACRW